MTKKQGITLAVVIERLDNLDKKVEEGFKGVWLRQDTTNGKVLKNITEISEIKVEMENVVKKEDCVKLHFGSENTNLKRESDISYKKITIIVAITSLLATILTTAITILSRGFYRG